MCRLLWRRAFASALVFLATLCADRAIANDISRQPSDAEQLITLVNDYVSKFGMSGVWLEVPQNGGPLREYRLLGTGWRITKCQSSWIVDTNFELIDDREAVGHFVIGSDEIQPTVLSLSFGLDNSLARYRETATQTFYYGISLLRLDTLR
jgi:hypothetical protein